jgi:hypothetical protein
VHEIAPGLDQIVTTALWVMGGSEVAKADNMYEALGEAAGTVVARADVAGPQGGFVAVAMDGATAGRAAASCLAQPEDTWS